MSSTIDTNNQRRNGRRFSLFSSQKVGVVDENETRRPNEKPSPPKQNPQRRRSLVEALNDLASKLDLDDEVVDSSDDEADADARLKVVSRQKSFPNEQRRRSSLPLSLGSNMPSMRRMSSGGVAMANSSSTKAMDYKRTITSSTDDMTSDDDRAFEATAADSTESLFGSDERFKCVDGFITLTSDADEGEQMMQQHQRRHRGPVRRRSLVDLANLVVQGEKE